MSNKPSSKLGVGWDGIVGYLTSHEAYRLWVGNHSGHNLHTRGKPNRNSNPVPPNQRSNHATNWAIEAGWTLWDPKARSKGRGVWAWPSFCKVQPLHKICVKCFRCFLFWRKSHTANLLLLLLLPKFTSGEIFTCFVMYSWHQMYSTPWHFPIDLNFF